MRGLLRASHLAGSRTAGPRRGRWVVAGAAFGAGLLLLLVAAPSSVVVASAAGLPSARPSAAPSHNDGVTPQPLESASGTFDAVDGYVLMFGGRGVSGAMDTSTWVFTRGNWSELPVASGVAPPARYESQMAYDSEDHEVVLFGGCADSGCGRVLNDTWSFAGDRWTNLTPLERHSPPARDRGMLVDDTADGGLLLFGGLTANPGTYLGDSWTFRGGQWTQLPAPLPSAAIPSARAGAAMVFDGAENETVLFGGSSAAGVMGDTWIYKGGNWTDLTSHLIATPGPRWIASAAYDSEQGVPVVVNGYDQGTYISDAWAFDGSSWAQLPDGSGPDASFGGLLVDDPLDGYMVYFSGVTTGFSLLTATFVYEQGSWTLLINPPGSSNLSLLGILLPLLILPLIFGIMFPISSRAQRRRERLLATGVNVGPGEVLRWIETPNVRSLYAGQTYVVLVFLVFPAIVLVPLATSGESLTGFLFFFGLTVGIYGGIAVALYVGTTRMMTRAIAVVDGGVIVRRSRGELRVAWENLQPSMIRPRKGRYWFQFLFPGKEQGQGGFAVTVEQARAILLDPRAPPWVLPRVVAEGLNVPARAVAALPAAAPPGPATAPLRSTPLSADGSGYARGFDAGGSGPVGPAAPPAYPSYSPLPPPAPPPAIVRPATPPPPSRPPPGMVACRNCGQLNPAGRVAFCRTCGQRLG